MHPPTTPSEDPARPSPFRHICAWCHCDLGALWPGSESHSYGICENCIQRYFYQLYLPESDLPGSLSAPPAEASGDPAGAVETVEEADAQVQTLAERCAGH